MRARILLILLASFGAVACGGEIHVTCESGSISACRNVRTFRVRVAGAQESERTRINELFLADIPECNAVVSCRVELLASPINEQESRWMSAAEELGVPVALVQISKVLIVGPTNWPYTYVRFEQTESEVSDATSSILPIRRHWLMRCSPHNAEGEMCQVVVSPSQSF